MILCSKLKNGLCKIVSKSQVVTKFNVTKSRLHSTIMHTTLRLKKDEKRKSTSILHKKLQLETTKS